MSNIGAYTAISKGDVVRANTVSSNINAITSAIFNSNMNSDNYGESTVESAHISANAILSQHISANQMVSEKLSTRCVVEDRMNYKSADGGVRVLRYGGGSASAPANGIMVGHYSKVVTVASVTDPASFSVVVSFADAIFGNPGFTAPPQIPEPAIYITNTSITEIVNVNVAGPFAVAVASLNSQSVVFEAHYSNSLPASASHVVTINFIAEGNI